LNLLRPIMRHMLNDILEELSSIFKGKTLDALLPPLVFVLLQSRIGLLNAVIVSVGIASVFGLLRLLKHQALGYALGGLGTVLVASSFALFANNASNFYLPGILSTTFLFVLMLISVLLDRPLAAYVSHLMRGWPLVWFWRSDVKPAYREVTWFWTSMFAFSTGIQWVFYLSGDLNQLVWITSLLGMPFTIFILVVTYVYGIGRLRQLKGPGVEEFVQEKKAPYKGQTRGF